MLPSERHDPAVEHRLDAQQAPVVRSRAGQPARSLPNSRFSCWRASSACRARLAYASARSGDESPSQRRVRAQSRKPPAERYARAASPNDADSRHRRGASPRASRQDARPFRRRQSAAVRPLRVRGPGRCRQRLAAWSGSRALRLRRTRPAPARARRAADRGTFAGSRSAMRCPRLPAPAAGRRHRRAPPRPSLGTPQAATSPARSRPDEDEEAVAAPRPRPRRSIRGRSPRPGRAGRAAPRACLSPSPPVRRPWRPNRTGHAPQGRRRPSGARVAPRTRKSPAPHVPAPAPPRRAIPPAPTPAGHSASARDHHPAPGKERLRVPFALRVSGNRREQMSPSRFGIQKTARDRWISCLGLRVEERARRPRMAFDQARVDVEDLEPFLTSCHASIENSLR